MTLQKTREIKGCSEYKSDSGAEYLLRQVSRKYEGKKNPPQFYLEQIQKPKNIYLSGLFKTDSEGVYSLDMKDKITGIRIMYNAIFKDSGEIITLEKKTKTE